MPRQRRGQGGDDDERIEPRLEIHHDQQINQHDGETKAGEQSDVGRAHGLQLPANVDEAAARKRPRFGIDNALNVRSDRAQIATLHGAVDIHHTANVVVSDNSHFIGA